MERKAKTIFQLDTPFKTVEWPEISNKDQKQIFELLCSIVSPIGKYRTDHVPSSKGKRSQKRKRQEAKEKAFSQADITIDDAVPPPPEIQKHIVVGLNSILRHLRSLSQASKPKQTRTSLEAQDSNFDDEDVPMSESPLPIRHFSAIFALEPTSNSSTLLTTHLPTLIHNSSLANSTLPPTRLIPLSQNQTTQLKTLLSLARTCHVGILDSAPGAEALIAVVRESVPEIKIPWLDESKKGEYLGVKINTVETFVGVSKNHMAGKKKEVGEG